MRYRHTQFGWLPLGIALLAVPAVVFVAGERDLATVVLPAAIVGLAALLFGALTVEITDDRLRLRFGIGLIRKSFRLDAIRAFAAVRTKWYHGWGIRITPTGMLYNVSGLSAVELVLDNGRHVRVGTNEPDALVRALEQATGVPVATSAGQLPNDERWHGRARLISGVTAILVVALVVGLFSISFQPPTVSITSGAFRVSNGWYSREIPVSEVTSVELVERLPRILRRTNGFAAGGTLRGHFRLEEWGIGQLYINRGAPPFVVVRTRESYVVVNFNEPGRTREIWARLREWVSAARP